MKHKLFIVVNMDFFFLSHRKEVALAANQIYDVTIVAKDTGKRQEIEELGFKFINLPLDRSGMNPKNELITFWFLYSLYKSQKPNLVHHVGLKVILWGSLAAKLAKVQAEVNAISGLGVLFSDKKQSLVSKTILQVLRFTHNRVGLSCIFQNNEDKNLFISNKIIKESQTDFIKGSGVDLSVFNYTKEPLNSTIRVLFTGRMIEEKGVLVLVEAARKIKHRFDGKVEFLLCGAVDDNPSALNEKDLRALEDGNYIQWLGFRTDVLQLLKQSHIVAFPSYYKEGLPKSLIEATAIGRPIITTNSTGCKETVEDGVNGFLIPIKDSVTLAEKLSFLLDNHTARVQMGLKSRELAEKYFSLDNVVDQHLKIYQKLLK